MDGSLAAFVAVSAVVICTPGQDTALTIRNTLTHGRRGGVATAAGVAAGQAIWTLAAAVGVVALLSASEPAFRALRLAGAAYLVYLGLHSLWSASTLRRWRLQPPERLQRTVECSSSSRAVPGFRQGLISNLGNPKMAVFFASLFPQFAPEGGSSFAALLVLGFLFCSMTLAWLTLYAVAVDRAKGLLHGRVRRALDAFTGAVLVLLGIRLATAER